MEGLMKTLEYYTATYVEIPKATSARMEQRAATSFFVLDVLDGRLYRPGL